VAPLNKGSNKGIVWIYKPGVNIWQSQIENELEKALIFWQAVFAHSWNAN